MQRPRLICKIKIHLTSCATMHHIRLSEYNTQQVRICEPLVSRSRTGSVHPSVQRVYQRQV